MNYDARLAQHAEEYNSSCKPCEDRYGDLNCYKCGNEGCEYRGIHHDKKKGE